MNITVHSLTLFPPGKSSRKSLVAMLKKLVAARREYAAYGWPLLGLTARQAAAVCFAALF